MSTLDQKLGAQSGQAVVFANNAAVALSRQAAERQRQLAEELRAPVVLETPAERAQKEEQPGDAEEARHSSLSKRDEDEDRVAKVGTTAGRRFDVRI